MPLFRFSLHFCKVFTLMFLVSLNVNAQEPVSYNLNDENGLPSNEVYQVLQDDFGFMWIGCDAGLFRYDGFTYKQFKNSAQNGRAISDIKLDKKGRIWCRNFKGEIYCVTQNNLKIVTKNIDVNVAHAVYDLDVNSNCWTLIDSKIYQLDDNGKILFSKEINYKHKKIEALNSIAVIGDLIYFADRENSIYVYTISSRNVTKIEKKFIQVEKNTFFKKGNKLFLMSEETISNTVSVFQIVRNKCTFSNAFSLTNKNPRVYAISYDNLQQPWVCTANGFAAYRSNFNQLNELAFYLQGKNVSSVLRDKEGNYWASTLQDGIFILPNKRIVKFTTANSALPENNLTALKSINASKMLIGSYAGKVYLFDSKKGTFTELKINQNLKTTSVKFFYPYMDAFYISHGPLSVLKNEEFIEHHPLYNSKSIEIVDGSLYFILSDVHGSTSLKNINNQKKFTFTNEGGRSLLYNPFDQTFYYGFNEGLFLLKNGEWKELKNKGKSIHVAEMVLHKKKICIASVSQGLFFVANRKISAHYNSTNAAIEDDLKCLKATDQYIWVCGLNRLVRIDLAKKEFAQFSDYNGLNTKDINAIETLGGNVYLACNKGLIVFPENSDWKNKCAPSLCITRISVDGQTIPLSKQINLPFENNRFIVELASISFKSRGNYTYEYRICGLDSLWTSAPAITNQLQFNKLPPGDYRFQVRAVNTDQIASEIKYFRIRVDSPIWQKWWFYLLISLFTVGIFALVFYFRLRYIKQKADQLNKLTASQLSALKAQMNPHFMFNALNSIQELVLQNDTLNSNIYLSKFSHLLRNILNASDTDQLSLQDEIAILQLYLDLEKLRFKDDFSFEIKLAHDIDPYSIFIPSMIIQPFVENALKHGLLHKKGMKKLTISFSMNEQLICEIEDNGIGRKHAQEIKERQRNSTSSFATQATEKRIELLNSFNRENYSFQIIDLEEMGQAKGTLVRITLPIH